MYRGYEQIDVVGDIASSVEEEHETKAKNTQVTWTDQKGTERCITKLTDGHIANLAPWLRARFRFKAEKIIQGELERRCTEEYPEWFESALEEYKQSPDIWRLKIY